MVSCFMKMKAGSSKINLITSVIGSKYGGEMIFSSTVGSCLLQLNSVKGRWFVFKAK